MYLDEYKRWLAAELDDADLKPELAKIEGNDDEITEPDFSSDFRHAAVGQRHRA